MKHHPEKFKRGEKYKIYWGPRNPNNETIHIVANLKNEKQIVYKKWERSDKIWKYFVLSYNWFKTTGDVTKRV